MLAALLAAAIVAPVHGVVLQRLAGGEAVVATAPVTQTAPAQTRAYRLVPAARVHAGTGIDAFLDRSTMPWTLRDPSPAGPFAPGLPDAARAVPVDYGSRLPNARLVDQNGHFVQLGSAFARKTVLLSFVFTRCPDRTLCPAISGKFAYLQSRLDPKRFALVEITLDPPYDSPAVLRAYGAAYGENPAIWSLLTGKGSQIQHLLDMFRISSMRVSSDNFIHDDRLFIVAPNGRVAYMVQTAGWDPQGVLAQARSVSGLASNPFERFKLSLIANMVAICGGSQYAGVALLELSMFLLIVLFSGLALWVIARVLWGRRRSMPP